MNDPETIVCQVCPHKCKVKAGASGICGVRTNTGNGTITLASYGYVSGYNTDPIEKKPLYHYYPGSVILSIGSYGCNFRCDCCQNFAISQGFDPTAGRKMTPDEIVADALKIPGNTGIAFTYNEPIVWFEFMRDIALKAKSARLKTVMVSNGYVSKEILQEIISFIDAFNIDLKYYNDANYRKYTGGTLNPVLETISAIATANRHLEITTLVIPTLNDSLTEIENISSWIADHAGADTPLHLSRYFPAFRRSTPATKEASLAELYDRVSRNLSFVYAGNAPSLGHSDTICPDCGTIVTKRTGYSTKHLSVTRDGKCGKCLREIYSAFTSPS
jgi:pyruvate formate lyase activating enzyme